MSELALMKTMQGLIPADDDSSEIIRKFKAGDILTSKFTKKRNPQFHRKFMALVKFAFDHWEPGELNTKHGKPEKNFDRFRHDLTIMAGFYTVVYNLKGEPRFEAKSISFAKMDDIEFEKVYSNVINAVLKHILKKYDREQLDRVVEELLRFDS